MYTHIPHAMPACAPAASMLVPPVLVMWTKYNERQLLLLLFTNVAVLFLVVVAVTECFLSTAGTGLLLRKENAELVSDANRADAVTRMIIAVICLTTRIVAIFMAVASYS